MREAIQICRGFSDEQWTGLRARLDQNDESAWNCAVEVFERRIRERFLACIEALMDADSQFKKFLRLPAFGGEFDDDRIATQFVRGVRSGILYEAETRGWVIWRGEPPGRIVERQGDRYLPNRSEFYRALKCEFEK